MVGKNLWGTSTVVVGHGSPIIEIWNSTMYMYLPTREIRVKYKLEQATQPKYNLILELCSSTYNPMRLLTLSQSYMVRGGRTNKPWKHAASGLQDPLKEFWQKTLYTGVN